MLVSLCVKNTEGITFEEISFVSKDRNKENSISVFKTKDDIYLNKQLAIIGANAVGKTSTLKAVENVCSFIRFPAMLERILQDFEDESEKELTHLKEMIKKLVKLNTNINSDDNSEVILEFYIETKDENTTGYYTYKIIFKDEDDSINIILEELYFRQKYLSKKNMLISKKENIKNSQVGYLYTFLNNLDNYEINLKYIETFVKKAVSSIRNISFDNISTNYATHDMIRYKKDIALKIINLVDTQIIDIVKVNENKENQKFNIEDYKFKMISGKLIEYEKLSKGTKKILSIISDVIELFKIDSTLLIDELDSAISKELIDIVFSTFYACKSKSQLIITTNYPDIIPESFKYDQIYMLKKVDGQTICSRLIDSKYNNGKKVRHDISFSRAYKDGKFVDEEENKSFKERIQNYINKLEEEYN